MTDTIKLPPWLPSLTRRDERTRAAHGLTPKRDGWYKSMGGRTRYVCKPMDVPSAVKMLAARQKALIDSGGVSAPRRRVSLETLTLVRLAEMFLDDCWQRVQGHGKKMARRTFEDYQEVLARFCALAGNDRPAGDIGPDDFTEFVRSLSGKADTTLRREIQYVDRLFNWAGPGKKHMNLIPFAQRGPNWQKPADHSDTDKAYAAADLSTSLAVAINDPLLHAAWHLGFGSGFGPRDCATLREDQVNLDEALITFPKGRGKTGMDRVCPLSPRAVDALREYLAARAATCKPDADGLLFRTKYGRALAKWYDGERRSFEDNHLSKRWSRETGLPYSGLRSTLATLLDDWHDQRAVDVILGHSSGDKAKHVRTVHYARQFNVEHAREAVAHAYALVFHGCDSSSAPRPS